MRYLISQSRFVLTISGRQIQNYSMTQPVVCVGATLFVGEGVSTSCSPQLGE